MEGRGGMRDVFDCPVCYTEFNRPLQLSCGHTVCAQCVDGMVTAERGGPVGNVIDEIAGGPMLRRRQHNIEEQMRERIQAVYAMDRGRDARDPDVLPPPRHPPPEPMMMGGVGLGGNYGPMPQPPPGHYPYRPEHLNFPFPPGPPQGIIENIQARYMRMHRNRRVLGMGTTRIRCPECRQHTEVPPNGLPVNYKLKELIERFRENGSRPNTSTIPAHTGNTSCSSCDQEISNGVYFGCGTCPDIMRVCSLCIVREHMGHEGIQEYKALTEQDVRELIDRMDQEASRGHEFVYKIGDGIGKLNDDAASLKDALETGIREYSNLVDKLKTMDRNCTKEYAERFVHKAGSITQAFAQLEMTVDGVRNKLCDKFKEITHQLKEEMRSILADIKNEVKVEIKQEPNENGPEVVLLSDDDEMPPFIHAHMQSGTSNVGVGNITIDVEDDENQDVEDIAQPFVDVNVEVHNEAEAPVLEAFGHIDGEINVHNIGEHIAREAQAVLNVHIPLRNRELERDLQIAMQIVREENRDRQAESGRLVLDCRRDRQRNQARQLATPRMRELRAEQRRDQQQRQLQENININNEQTGSADVVDEFANRMRITDRPLTLPHAEGNARGRNGAISPAKKRKKRNEKNDEEEPGPSRQVERRRIHRVTRRHPDQPGPSTDT